jgi:hypothetical protein
VKVPVNHWDCQAWQSWEMAPGPVCKLIPGMHPLRTRLHPIVLLRVAPLLLGGAATTRSWRCSWVALQPLLDGAA